jgi:sulfur relay (sulfurtransferase) DsrF/TusC family protein
VENIQYPADWLANGGPPFDGLRKLETPLDDYAALTLIRDDGVWKVVAGDDNTVLAEADYENILEYISTYAWHVENAERKAANS